ncbi:LOW QUALITY PROTEIN: hypothetical protein ACHAWO_005824 [Cyclotella atomus]|uniref:Uncharacterized protein n=1 Tax=Cyclotella atomus TaxID=382360 RepID=A0ABD3P9Y6_9STRA
MSCDGDFNDGVYLGAEVAERSGRSKVRAAPTSGDLKTRFTLPILAIGGRMAATRVWKRELVRFEFFVPFVTYVSLFLNTNSIRFSPSTSIDQMVAKYEKQCLARIVLMNAVAWARRRTDVIAFDYCPFSAQSTVPLPMASLTTKASCPYGVCEGAIYGYARDNGCSISTSKLGDLQDKCEDQVVSMTGGDANAALSKLLRKNVKMAVKNLRTN